MYDSIPTKPFPIFAPLILISRMPFFLAFGSFYQPTAHHHPPSAPNPPDLRPIKPRSVHSPSFLPPLPYFAIGLAAPRGVLATRGRSGSREATLHHAPLGYGRGAGSRHRLGHPPGVVTPFPEEGGAFQFAPLRRCCTRTGADDYVLLQGCGQHVDAVSVRTDALAAHFFPGWEDVAFAGPSSAPPPPPVDGR